jgi:hypothetical protein
MMNSEEFRDMAHRAVDCVARYLDEFPELYCTIRVRGSFGVIVVGLEEREPDQPEADPD